MRHQVMQREVVSDLLVEPLGGGFTFDVELRTKY